MVTMTDTIFQTADLLRWQPHPAIAGARMVPLIPGQEGLTPVVALVELPTSISAEPHWHVHADDVLYILRGQGTMWIEGQGEVSLEEGCFLRIPAGVRHCPRQIHSALMIYNLWLPAGAKTQKG